MLGNWLEKKKYEAPEVVLFFYISVIVAVLSTFGFLGVLLGNAEGFLASIKVIPLALALGLIVFGVVFAMFRFVAYYIKKHEED